VLWNVTNNGSGGFLSAPGSSDGYCFQVVLAVDPEGGWLKFVLLWGMDVAALQPLYWPYRAENG
jgi:hypothetical protein